MLRYPKFQTQKIVEVKLLHLVVQKISQIVGAPLPRQMHQALAERVVGSAATAVFIAAVAVVDDGLGHHHFLRDFAPLAGLRLQRLLRTLRGRVPRVVGARTELLLAVRVAARAAVAAVTALAPEVRAEAGLP